MLFLLASRVPLAPRSFFPLDELPVDVELPDVAPLVQFAQEELRADAVHRLLGNTEFVGRRDAQPLALVLMHQHRPLPEDRREGRETFVGMEFAEPPARLPAAHEYLSDEFTVEVKLTHRRGLSHSHSIDECAP